MPPGLLVWLLLIPLRGQEPRQKQAVIPDWGRWKLYMSATIQVTPPVYLVGKKIACWRCAASMPVVAIIVESFDPTGDGEGESIVLSEIVELPEELRKFLAFCKKLSPKGYASVWMIALRITSSGAGRLNQISNERAPWCRSMDRPFATRAPALRPSSMRRESPVA